MLRGELTNLLRGSIEGDGSVEQRLIDLLYPELHEIASRLMRRERSGHTLQTTALLHQAYIRLSEGEAVDWKDRAHFLGVAAHVMRNVLIDYARNRKAGRRGGPSARRVSLEGLDVYSAERSEDILAVHEALLALTETDARAAEILEGFFFGGLNVEELAAFHGISSRTVKRELAFAKAWVYRQLAPVAQ